MMTLPGLALLFLVQAPVQEEPVFEMIIKTKDGQSIAGVAASKSLRFESSLGVNDLSLKNLKQIRFEEGAAVVVSTDATTLRGKLTEGTLGVVTVFGNLALKAELLKEIAIRQAHPNRWEVMRPKGRKITLLAQLKDGNELVGIADLAGFEFESTFGKLWIELRFLDQLTRKARPDHLVLADSTELNGTVRLIDFKLASLQGEFSIKADSVLNLGFRQMSGPTPGSDIELEPGRPSPFAEPSRINPTATVKLQAPTSGLRVSKDGGRAYTLVNGALRRWKLPLLEEDGSVTVKAEDCSFALDPSGKKIFVAGAGGISVFSVQGLELEGIFSIGFPLADLHAFDSDFLAVVGGGKAALVKVSQSQVVQRLEKGGSRIQGTERGDRIYVDGNVFGSVKDVTGIRLEYLFSMPLRPGSGSGLLISADGRYGVYPSNGDGTILRLGRSAIAASAPLAWHHGRDFRCATFSLDGRRALLFGNDGRVLMVHLDDAKPFTNHRLDMIVTHAVPEPGGTGLLILGSENSKPTPDDLKTNLHRIEWPR